MPGDPRSTPRAATRRDFLAVAATAITPLVLGARRPWVAVAERAAFTPWLEIDSAAIAHNVAALARRAGTPIIAVAKNNAYGLGLSFAGPVLDRLEQVTMLAVVRPEEALELRRAGVKKPILLMGPATEEELLALVPLDVVQSPYRAEAPALLRRVGERLGRPVRVHAYVDTGMHRMGMPVGEALSWLQAMTRAGVRVEGAFTELVEDADFDRAQCDRLRALQRAAREAGVALGTLHAASTDAVQHGNDATFLDAVRPGLGLYGGYVSPRARAAGGLRAAYRLKARVIRVDRLAAGEGVSYHRRWTTREPAWVATLGIGHVDGYPSGAVKGCEVLAGGRLHPVIGTVSASHTLIALGAEQTVRVGDEATLVGDHAALHPNEVASRAGYSEYDMFMHLSPQLERRVV